MESLKTWIRFQLKNLRFYVLLLSFAVAIAVYVWATVTPPSYYALGRLIRMYGLLAFAYLYFALLASPFTLFFKNFPFKGHYLHMRRAIGVSSFGFAALHSYFVVYKVFGGPGALLTLTGVPAIAIWLGVVSFSILFLLTLTSFDFVVKKITFKKWKLLHRLVYFAGFFVLIHATLIGEDIIGSLPIRILFYGAVSFLLVLEGVRIYKYFLKLLASRNVQTGSQ